MIPSRLALAVAALLVAAPGAVLAQEITIALAGPMTGPVAPR